MDRIYLDNQSTTFLADDVIAAMTEAMRQGYANPASQHEFGRRARKKMEACRESISVALGLGRNDRCLFTSGGTEANNLAVLGHFPDASFPTGSNLVCSAIEHPSVLAVLDHLRTRGVEIRLVAPEQTGRVAAADFASRIDERTRLVACMWVNNETGVVQPIEDIADICRYRGIPFHVDAVQGIGKLPFAFETLGCSSATVSAHKIHGPTGIGGLLVAAGSQLVPRNYGGFQQEGIRPGTESIPLAVGFARAIESAVSNLPANAVHLRTLRDRFESLLRERIPGISVNGGEAPRAPHATNLSFPGIDRQQFVLAADVSGLACSTGSACSSGSSQPSPVLSAMGCDKAAIDGAIRFGFSIRNGPADVDAAVDRIERIVTAKNR